VNKSEVGSNKSERQPGEVATVLCIENLQRSCVYDFRRFGMEKGVGEIHGGQIVVSFHGPGTARTHKRHTFVRIPPLPNNIAQTIDLVDSQSVYESQSLFQGLKIGVNVREYR
jgi:hypothetical protein